MIPLAAMPAAAPVLLADSDAGKGSPIGLLVVLLLVVAVYFLYRSMNRHLRKVPPQFDQQQVDGQQFDEQQRPAADGQPADGQPPVEPSATEPERDS